MVAKHAGNWSRVAWIVISDTRVTESAARGYYPVYSFFENGKKIMLSLGQGYKDIKTKYKKEADNILISRGIILKNKAGDFKKYGFKNVHGTKITIKSDKEREVWVKSCAFGKIYDVKNMPSNNDLINDIKNILNIYENIIVLEDDLFVSPYFYKYANDALKFYNKTESIGGISLYNHKRNFLNTIPFELIPDSNDVFFLQIASSWGQAWSKKQWLGFKNWYNKYVEKEGR